MQVYAAAAMKKLTLLLFTLLASAAFGQFPDQQVIVQHADRATCERLQPTITYQCVQYVQVWLQSPTFRDKTLDVTIQYTTSTGEFRTQTKTLFMDPAKVLTPPGITWLAVTFADDIDDITLGVVTVVEQPTKAQRDPWRRR